MAGEDRGLDKVRPVIRASWQRCHQLRVDPYLQKLPVILPAAELEREQERADLIYVATPVFETIIRAWADEPFLLGLSDRHGHILLLRGHPWVLQRAMEINAVPGGGMTEEQIGTAIANVVLSQGHTDYVLWSEHYCRTFHPWASLGAPIHHPSTHEIIGVVSVAGDELTHTHVLDIIEYVTLRLAQLLHREELVRRMTLLDAYHQFLLQHPQDTVLAIDGRGRVCGVAPSITQFLEAPEQILGESLLRVPGLQVEGMRHLTQLEDVQPYELRVTATGRGLSFRATAIPIRGERQPAGTLLLLPHPVSLRQRRALSSPWRTTYTFADLVGHAPAFQRCLTLARQVAQQDFPLLLLGESGTGKELLAQAIHAASPRSQGPFVVLNCGATSDELLAAELFGYVEGAFTGAAKGGKKGKLELAHGGTLFLDEVETMSPRMQVSLLRVLEEGLVTRVGADRPLMVDVRIIAASNEDLQAATREKRFRLDLYHRLSSFPLTLPPLRARIEDLPLLAQHLLGQLGFPHLQLAPAAEALLARYSWPGNVRELKNVLRRAAHLANGTFITPAQLPQEIHLAAAGGSLPIAGSLRDTERELILRALDAAAGDVTRAAVQLGIHRATLYRKLKKYRLSAPRGLKDGCVLRSEGNGEA